VIHRMTAAALSLIGFFVALYLSLWKLGMMGPMVCATEGCETVQLSEYSVFLGVPVAFYGLAGFTVLFAVSLAGLQGRWSERKEPSVLLLVLSGIGVAFAAYLTYLEAAVIHAWCQWCIACAVLITALFLVSIAGLVRWPRATA
jgi:uncharacterized membrane protein